MKPIIRSELNTYFALQNPTADGTKTIYLLCSYYQAGARMQFKVSTKIKISPKVWNAKKSEIKPQANNYRTYNERLQSMSNKAHELFEQYEEVPNKSQFMQDLRMAISRQPNKSKLDFFDYMEHWINERGGDPNFTEGTIKTYKQFAIRIHSFGRSMGEAVTFDNIDAKFQERFASWLASDMTLHYPDGKVRHVKPYVNATIHKTLRTLRTFMNFAEEDKRIESAGKSAGRPKVGGTLDVYLNKDEVVRMHQADLKKNEAYVRDLFVLGCVTGLRFSDYGKANRENLRIIDGKHYLQPVQFKARRDVLIPLNWVALEILERYDFRIPAPKTNQHINRTIKGIAESCGINDEFVKVRYSLSNRIEQRGEKWEFVTTHTARRSFATNLFIAGVAIETISKVMGHSSVDTTRGYIMVTEIEHSQIAGKALEW